MENTVISNTQELQVEIARLQAIRSAQKDVLAACFKGHVAIFNSAKSLLPTSEENAPNLLQKVLRFAIPFVLNRTICRKANFITKRLVGLVSRIAAGVVTGKSLESALLTSKSLISKLFSKT